MADTTVRDLNNPFADVWKALDPKAQRKAMKGAMRKEANNVKKAAQAAMDGSGLGKGTKQAVKKGIYARVFPDRYGLGAMVTTVPHGKKGIHTNRRGQQKPVAMWADGGTKERHVGKRTSSKRIVTRTGRKGRSYERNGHSTGKMPDYGFMKKAEEQMADGVRKRLAENLERNIKKTAGKLGLL